MSRSDRIVHAVAPLNALSTALQRQLEGGVSASELEPALEFFQQMTGAADADLVLLRGHLDRCRRPSTEEQRAQAVTLLWTLVEGYRDALVKRWSPRPAGPPREGW